MFSPQGGKRTILFCADQLRPSRLRRQRRCQLDKRRIATIKTRGSKGLPRQLQNKCSETRSSTCCHSRLWYGEPSATSNAIEYAKFYSRSHDAVIRVYDEAGNVIETHQNPGTFKECCGM